MKAVRVLAVADASALPGLRRALSPESIELVGVASTPGSVLAQMLRVCPDVVVVDLSLSRTDVFRLIAQLVQEHAVTVLALASGEEAASLAERAHGAGASDVVERRTVSGSWHEESGSPHVLSLRVLSLAASARPRPSKLSLRLRGTSPVPPLSAAPTAGSSREGVTSRRASTLSGAEPSGPVPGALQSAFGQVRGAASTSPAASSMPVPGKPPSAASSCRAAVSGAHTGPLMPAPGAPPSAAGLPRGGVSGMPVGPSMPVPGVPPSDAGVSRGAVSSPPAGSSRSSPVAQSSAAALSRGAVSGMPAAPSMPARVASQSAAGLSRDAVSAAPAGATLQGGGMGVPPSAAGMSGVPRSRGPKAGRPLMAARIELVAIGASTGGTLALAELLKILPESAPPMLVVQHMLPEFTNDFAQRLNELCDLNVRIAVDGEQLESGTVLLAPGGRHLRVVRDTEQRLRAQVTDELPVGKHRPSVDVLFQACAETLGSAAVGVLLTGMGDDGARGLLALHNRGARTLVQDQASSVCFGMPSAAIALGAAQQILPLRDIAETLRELVKPRDAASV